MTQEQKQRFFERLGIDLRGWFLISPGFNQAENRIRNESPEMFLALVESCMYAEKLLEIIGDHIDDKEKFDDARIKAIQNASGKPWQEIREIYEECINEDH